IALVSDAGTPLISDPGNVLVEGALKKSYKVIPISGISALTTLLCATSRKDEDFKFIGFISRSENQIKETISNNNEENLVFYESPKRLISTLEIISKYFPNKIITVGRELTKKFEEIKTGNIQEILNYYKNNPLKGEIACLLHKNKSQEKDYLTEIKKLKQKGFKDKEIALILSELFCANKNTIYKTCLEIKD
ncbi:16S rRNA (cytidine(1402)-2'-O)-methyltransferase, partial [bacterium]|nr:16S rRNA (cytidine(1402)-2'-O)-methyltransferase [bacterium]